MEEWFKDWFDADYAALYAHRDAAEAALAVRTALSAAPPLASGPVLDLGCGTGRHLAELRKVNAEAFGLDLSPHLLGLAPRALNGWLLRGDMRHLPIRPRSLSGICLWFTPFGYFSDEENRRLLQDLQGLLAPGGVLLLDLMNARRLRAELVAEDTVERNGLRVLSQRTFEAGRIVKRMAIEHLDSGAMREAVESVRVYEAEELRTMAGSCGLLLRRELGNYEGSPFDEEASPRWLGIYQKKSMADQ
jgi:SAM-dependent methyltransferase